MQKHVTALQKLIMTLKINHIHMKNRDRFKFCVNVKN